jgi:hypothetical protein
MWIISDLQGLPEEYSNKGRKKFKTKITENL